MGGASSIDVTKSKFKHHDSGFHSMELSDFLSDGKRQFNANSVTSQAAKFDERASQRNNRQSTNRATGYNLLSGAPNQYFVTKDTFAKKTMLPPPKDFINNGHGKAEYKKGFEASPRVFHRQNGDMTYFQSLKVSNNLISSKNFSQKMSASLFN